MLVETRRVLSEPVVMKLLLFVGYFTSRQHAGVS